MTRTQAIESVLGRIEPSGLGPAPDSARRSFVEIILVALLVVAALGGLYRRRLARRAARNANARRADTMPVPKTKSPSPPRPAPTAKARILTCPVCDRDFREDRTLKFCPTDGSKLVVRGSAPGDAGPRDCLVCPACERGYADGDVCEVDGEELLPKALAAAARLGKVPQNSAPQAPSEPKVCPTCGLQTAGANVYCTRDGAALTLLQ